MTTKKWKLLASAGKPDDILKLVNKYYYSETAQIVFEKASDPVLRSEGVLNKWAAVYVGAKRIENVRVIPKGRRFRFEREDKAPIGEVRQ